MNFSVGDVHSCNPGGRSTGDPMSSAYPTSPCFTVTIVRFPCLISFSVKLRFSHFRDMKGSDIGRVVVSLGQIGVRCMEMGAIKGAGDRRTEGEGGSTLTEDKVNARSEHLEVAASIRGTPHRTVRDGEGPGTAACGEASNRVEAPVGVGCDQLEVLERFDSVLASDEVIDRTVGF
jgi:hypothetical protein